MYIVHTKNKVNLDFKRKKTITLQKSTSRDVSIVEKAETRGGPSASLRLSPHGSRLQALRPRRPPWINHM